MINGRAKNLRPETGSSGCADHAQHRVRAVATRRITHPEQR
jgi:hypothetical protein